MRIRLVFLISHSLAALSWAGAALATPDFPAIVQQWAGAAAPPPCTICHNNQYGGLGTATTPFGTYMRSLGVVAFNEDSLRNALAADLAAKHDSSGDGTTDIDALSKGLDPNGTAAPSEPPPAYGCGAQISPRTGSVGTAQAILLTLALAGLARRLRGRVNKQST